jgi:hypothetical protein
MPREAKRLWLASALFALVAVAGLLGLDAIVARWTAAGAAGTLWDVGTRWLDLATLKPVSNFLLGGLLLLVAGLLLIVPRTRRLGWPLLYVALVQFLSTVVADLAKPPFGRMRPFEAAAHGGADIWWVGANSFPSGHIAFYAGLFFPLMLLFPRWAVLLALPPLFVATARIVEHDHYVGDAAASLALAAALSAALSFLPKRG